MSPSWPIAELHEECGVFGVHKVEHAARNCYYGLHSLQHRGQEAAGIAASDGDMIRTVKGPGLVTEVLDRQLLDSLVGFQAIGHVRYCTEGENIIENTQPIMVRSHQGNFALAHNGQIVNSRELRYELEHRGSIFQGTSDTEVIAHLVQRAQGSFAEKIQQACSQLVGAFSVIIMTKNTMYAIRDKHGIHPLSIGKIGEGWIFSSETCAFEIVNANYIRDVRPGEIVKVGKNGFESHFYSAPGEPRMCAMEYIYFSRPDTILDERNVHTVRKESGRLIAKHDPVEADIVVGVPDSSLSAAMGYAEARGLPYEMGLIKNKYVGRTFIQPNQMDRDRGVKMKLSAVSSIVRGKRLVLVDDSIVRGTTCRRIVRMLREAGAKEVHVRIVSAPLISPCFYGVDMTTKAQLISAHLTPEQLRQDIQADSLQFLSIPDMISLFGDGICLACFNADYVTDLYSWQDHI